MPWIPLSEYNRRKRNRPARRRAGFGAAGSGWSAPIQVGRLRYQAKAGTRAAVLELRPGLYLVAEVPEEKARDEFGFAPVLVPMVIRAARHAIDNPPRLPGRGPEPLALPGPVAPEWADPEVAAEFGCAACDGRCGRSS